MKWFKKKNNIQPKVLIATMSGGAIDPDTLKSWNDQSYKNIECLAHIERPTVPPEYEEWQKYLSKGLLIKRSKSWNVARHREKLRKLCLQTDADYFLITDSDIILPKNAVSELLLQAMSIKKSVISGYYIMRESDRFPVARLIADGTVVYISNIEPSITKADYTGFGCVMMPRKLLEKVKIGYDFSTYLKVYGTKPELKVYLPDDWHFCNQIFKHGYQLFVDGSVICGHNPK